MRKLRVSTYAYILAGTQKPPEILITDHLDYQLQHSLKISNFLPIVLNRNHRAQDGPASLHTSPKVPVWGAPCQPHCQPLTCQQKRYQVPCPLSAQKRYTGWEGATGQKGLGGPVRPCSETVVDKRRRVSLGVGWLGTLQCRRYASLGSPPEGPSTNWTWQAPFPPAGLGTWHPCCQLVKPEPVGTMHCPGCLASRPPVFFLWWR